MKLKYIYNKSAQFTLFFILIFGSCKKDPYQGVVSNEKSIENFSMGLGFTQIGAAVVDRDQGKVSVKVLVEDNTDFSKVSPIIQQSYRAAVFPNSGAEVDFLANDFKVIYDVVSESGESKKWEVQIEPFQETLTGEYLISDLVVFGGTGPEYGGGAVISMASKPWLWSTENGPEVELDNKLTFTLTGVTPEGKTMGKFINDAGEDGLYTDFIYVQDPRTNVNDFYRKLPKGEGQWERDYTTDIVTFIFSDGKRVNSKFVEGITENLGNNMSKTITDQAFVFDLKGNDDWDNIYSDYDKFIKKPRRYWIEVIKQN